MILMKISSQRNVSKCQEARFCRSIRRCIVIILLLKFWFYISKFMYKFILPFLILYCIKIFKWFRMTGVGLSMPIKLYKLPSNQYQWTKSTSQPVNLTTWQWKTLSDISSSTYFNKTPMVGDSIQKATGKT